MAQQRGSKGGAVLLLLCITLPAVFWFSSGSNDELAAVSANTGGGSERIVGGVRDSVERVQRALRGSMGAVQVPSMSWMNAWYRLDIHESYSPLVFLTSVLGAIWLASIALQILWLPIRQRLETPSRPYKPPEEGGVGAEYDAWTTDGVLEHYWGEHIHAGIYENDSSFARDDGFWMAFLRATFSFGGITDFKKSKIRFSEDLWTFGGTLLKDTPESVLDVGCGFGGTTRMLAKAFPTADVKGITLSSEQVKRATQLADEQSLGNCRFFVEDALQMSSIPDASQDLVWACECGEHMSDKKQWINEMTRVLKPDGRIVIAMWCEKEPPHTRRERHLLDYLYDEWAHPQFISSKKCAELMSSTGKLEKVQVQDWTDKTLATWRHSVFVGMWSPWRVMFSFSPRIWWRTCREIWALEKMHEAFHDGAMHYGVLTAQKC